MRHTNRCAAAVPVFLCFNLASREARIPKCFLGDSGALLLGLLVGWAMIDSTQAADPIIQPITVLWLAALPLYDTLFVMGYRALHGRSPMSADRNHIHHLLADHGMTPRQGLVAVLAGAAVLASVGLALDFAGAPDIWSFVGVCTTFLAYVAMALSLHRRRPEADEPLTVSAG